MSRLVRIKALVLKKHKYGEADNVLRLLSPTAGRVGAIAKGVRKTTSRFGARLEPFSHIDVMLHPGRNLATVTQVETIESFDEVRTDYDRLSHGAVVLDLLDRVATEDSGDERLFGLGLATLRALANDVVSQEWILAAFEAKLMAVIGYRPHLSGCVICGTAPGSAFFSARAGGVMCEGCALTDPASIPVEKATLDCLDRLLLARMAELGPIVADESCEEELGVMLRGFVACHVQARLKSQDFLGRGRPSGTPQSN